MYFRFFPHLTFFTSGHKYWPVWARMDPHGPVYHYMLLLYDLYIFTEIDFHFFHLTFFTSGHKYVPIWAHMGAYGPVYDFILILYDVYNGFTLFLYGFRCFLYVFTFVDIFWKLILHMFITFLEKFKDHFCSPPAPDFASKCEVNFPIFLHLREHL